MERRKRLILVGLIVVLGGVLVLYQNLMDKNPRGDQELQGLIEGFMKTLPDTTTVEQRGEIQGIMDRFYYSAIRGNVAADDVISIEGDLRGYVEKGRIPAEELFPFMSKVGKATRRGNSASGEPTG
jgi:hypothetical protein